MGHTAHKTAHFCGMPAMPWDNSWQKAGHARTFAACRIIKDGQENTVENR
jgi:hypothetical protein